MSRLKSRFKSSAKKPPKLNNIKRICKWRANVSTLSACKQPSSKLQAAKRCQRKKNVIIIKKKIIALHIHSHRTVPSFARGHPVVLCCSPQTTIRGLPSALRKMQWRPPRSKTTHRSWPRTADWGSTAGCSGPPLVLTRRWYKWFDCRSHCTLQLGFQEWNFKSIYCMAGTYINDK